MKKQLKSLLLLTLTLISTVTFTPAQAARHQNSGDSFFITACFACGVAFIATGISALVCYACKACRWSPEDILAWAEEGTFKLERKYQTMINDHNGPLLARLKLFGSKTKCYNTRNRREDVIAQNPKLFPLHNAELGIKNDKEQLHDFLYYLHDRDMRRAPINTTIHALLDQLEHWADSIMASADYSAEEKAIDEKLDRLTQQALEKERNDALHRQANAAYEQAEALHRQADRRTDVIIIR